MILVVCLLIGAVLAVLAFVVADDLRTAPSVMPVDPVSGPDLPRTKSCPLNAEPHWCCDSSDDEVLAVMEKQLTDVKVPRRFR